MVTHPIAVGHIGKSLAILRPTWGGIEVAAIGDVEDRLTSLCAHNPDITIGGMCPSDILQSEPMSIRRPSVVYTSRAFVVLGTVGDGAQLLRLQVINHKFGTIQHKGELLAIGRELRVHLLPLHPEGELLLDDIRCIGEVGILATSDACLIEFPRALLRRGIDQCAVVRTEGHPTSSE